MYIMGLENPILTNSIVWNNIKYLNGIILNSSIGQNSTDIIITYTNIDDNDFMDGEGNINADPLFTDPENGDYTLQAGSPCIDTGTADTDSDGYEDITDYCGTAPDMGAYEYCEELSVTPATPISYQIQPAYPNPFNPATTISFSIPDLGLTTITAYDINGRQLETLTNEVLSVGNYSINWNASSYPSGVYLIRMVSGQFTQTQKVLLVK